MRYEWKEHIWMIIPLIVGLMMIPSLAEAHLELRGLKHNHCLEEDIYFYRLESGFLSTYEVATSEENADSYDFRCIMWEEEPSMQKTLLGQEQVYNKGQLWIEKQNLEESA